MDSKLKKYVKIYLLVGILLLMLGYGANHSILFISKPSGSNNPQVQIQRTDEGVISNVRFGINIIRNGQFTIDFINQNKETRKTITTRPFGFQRVNADLAPQKKLVKVATNAKPCILGAPRGDYRETIYSYDCNSLPQIDINNIQESLEATATDTFFNLDKAVLYNGKVVGLKFTENDDGIGKELYVITNDKEYASYPLNHLADDLESNYLINSDTKSVIIVDTKNGSLVRFADGMSAPELSKIQLPEPKYTIVSSHVKGDDLYLYGVEPLEVDGEGAGDAKLNVYSLAQKKLTTTVTVRDRNITEATIGGLQAINNNTFIGIDPEGGRLMTTYRLNERGLYPIDTFGPTLQTLIVNNTIYVLSTDGKVYVYNPSKKEAHLIFGSKNTKILEMHYSGTNIYLTGSSESDRHNSRSNFILSSNDNDETTRPEDILPIGDEFNGTPVSLIDYVGKSIITYTTPVGYKSNSREENKIMLDKILEESKVNLKTYQQINL